MSFSLIKSPNGSAGYRFSRKGTFANALEICTADIVDTRMAVCVSFLFLLSRLRLFARRRKLVRLPNERAVRGPVAYPKCERTVMLSTSKTASATSNVRTIRSGKSRLVPDDGFERDGPHGARRIAAKVKRHAETITEHKGQRKRKNAKKEEPGVRKEAIRHERICASVSVD